LAHPFAKSLAFESAMAGADEESAKGLPASVWKTALTG
jgi:hypothetical protein